MTAPNERSDSHAEELEAVADRMASTVTATNLRQAAATMRRINGDQR